jgi:hypothetical protein
MKLKNLTKRLLLIEQEGQVIEIPPEEGFYHKRNVERAAKFGPLDIWEEWFEAPELPKPEKNTLLVVSKEIARHWSVRKRTDLVYYSRKEKKLMVVRK